MCSCAIVKVMTASSPFILGASFLAVESYVKITHPTTAKETTLLSECLFRIVS